MDRNRCESALVSQTNASPSRLGIFYGACYGIIMARSGKTEPASKSF